MSPTTVLPPSAVTVADAALSDELTARLAGVEKMLQQACEADYPLLTDVSRHLVDAGGKRYRPLLVCLAAQLGDPDAPGVAEAAAVVELTHLATLFHDDVMDEASLRRGAPSANLRWGNTVAILTGDFLFAQASDLLADLGAEAVRLQARTFARLVKGQVRETVGPTEHEDAVDHHLSVLADKTASLIATSARFGAMLSGAGEKVADALAAYGEAFGMAFQLSDDLLDIASDSADSGKTPGTDLREGVQTLPVLLAREAAAARSAGPDDRALVAALDADLTSDAALTHALGLLRAHPAMAAARTETVRWAEQARSALVGLPDSPAVTTLHALCQAVVARTA